MGTRWGWITVGLFLAVGCESPAAQTPSPATANVSARPRSVRKLERVRLLNRQRLEVGIEVAAQLAMPEAGTKAALGGDDWYRQSVRPIVRRHVRDGLAAESIARIDTERDALLEAIARAATAELRKRGVHLLYLQLVKLELPAVYLRSKRNVDQARRANQRKHLEHRLALVLTTIAMDIERLKSAYPQLAGFNRATHLHLDKQSISYGYHTHRSKRRGGWTAAVPNPNPDGIWFYIDVHDPASTRQIHTQPVVERLFFEDQHVTFLILEGKNTTRVAAKLRAILLARGVRTRPR